MSVTVRTPDHDHDNYEDADDFLADEIGRLTVMTSNDRGDTQVVHAVYAPGGWAAVFNDDGRERDS